MRIIVIILLVVSNSLLQAQVANVAELDSALVNWHNRDVLAGTVAGTSVDRVYNELLKNKEPKKTVIVAVIDSGVDIYHEDLKDQVWLNEDEVAGDSIDNDNNGYIDDIHGWNFIGSTSGENVYYENLEITRIVRKGESDSLYQQAKALYDKELTETQEEAQNLKRFLEIYFTAKAIIKEGTGVDVTNVDSLALVESDNERVNAAKSFLEERYAMGLTEDGLEAFVKQVNEIMNYHLNLEFTPREVIGDDPEDINDRAYGNIEVRGPRADHGTSVAGVIAATRNNGIGIDGVTNNVKIMSIRTVPLGDERDKDVALAIRYAVDNGADVVNMSFGKDLSPQKDIVDDAVRYAEENGVLLIHAAGNDGQNIDEVPSYPTGYYLDGKEATNWLSIGASDQILDESFAASFSNYGENHVDLFAPGVSIISTDTTNTYSAHDGTSLAAPVVSGIAALLLSYYPDLTPQQVIDVLMESAYKIDNPKKVLLPTEEFERKDKAPFSTLAKSGGLINAYQAFQLADKRYAKK